ncbi:MAG: BatD family protein, partial [Bacteroidota bacterium]
MLCYCLAADALAQDASFDASVDKNPVALGDQFTLSLTLNNAGMGGGKNMKLPDLSKFYIMSGPNQSSSMQFINGAVSSSVTTSYVLQGKDVGKFTIGSATIEVGGKEYKTQPLTIEVVKGTPRPKQQVNAPASDIGAQIGDNLFLKASVDRNHVILGEQINVTFKVYERVTVNGYKFDKSPTMAGFWSEDLEVPSNLNYTIEVVNGKQYRMALIRRIALFPTQSGTLEISPMELSARVQVRTRSLDPFDAFFRDPFGQLVDHKIKSEPIKIKVDPLPPGAPPGFKGAVGRFTMNTSVDKKTTKTNEPITLKVTISGTGNIKVLEMPELDLPKDFEQYNPKVSDNINRQEGKISGSKTFEYLLIPRYPGQKSIKPVAFSYYDLNKRDYVTLQSPEIELNIEQGTATAPPVIAGGTREDVQLLSQDIRFIKVAQPAFTRPGDHPYKSGVFIVLVLLPIAGLAGAIVYSRQRQAEMLDAAGYRNRRALKVAQKGLKQAEQLLAAKMSGNSSQKLEFYSEVSRALHKYLGDKLNMWAYARVDTINDRMLKKMKQAGINWVAYGFESASAEVRRGVAKKFQQSIISQAVEMTRAAGIYIIGNFIFGLPDDNLET